MAEKNDIEQHPSSQQIKAPVIRNLWFWAVIVLSLIIIAMGAFILRSMIPFRNGDVAKISAANIPISQQQSLQKPASLSQQDFDDLYPGWTFLGQQPVLFSNANYAAVVMGQGRIYNGAGFSKVQVRVSICENKSNHWYETWHIPKDVESLCFIDNKNNANSEASSQILRNFIALQDSKAALIVANIPTVAGSADDGSSEIVAVTVDSDGNCNLQMMDASGSMTAKKIDSTHIEVTGEGGYGTHELYLQDGAFHQDIIPLSQMSPQQAVQAKFMVGSDGTLYPAETADLTVHVGQTIAFVPGNDQAKELFDSGHIKLYSDAWNGSPLTLCEANRIKTGNSYTFDKAGLCHFCLITDDQLSQFINNYQTNQGVVTQPTFNVMVQP